MLTCPTCSANLERATLPEGVMYVCPQCGGHSVAFGVLRKLAPPEFFRRLWTEASAGGAKPGCRCPRCDKPSSLAVIPDVPEPLRLDVCPRCQCVWFDARELEDLMQSPPFQKVQQERQADPRGDNLSPEAAEALARFQLAHEERMQDAQPGPASQIARAATSLGSLGPRVGLFGIAAGLVLAGIVKIIETLWWRRYDRE